jgi:hypothetical protein
VREAADFSSLDVARFCYGARYLIAVLGDPLYHELPLLDFPQIS